MSAMRHVTEPTHVLALILLAIAVAPAAGFNCATASVGCSSRSALSMALGPAAARTSAVRRKNVCTHREREIESKSESESESKIDIRKYVWVCVFERSRVCVYVCMLPCADTYTTIHTSFRCKYFLESGCLCVCLRVFACVCVTHNVCTYSHLHARTC